MPSPTLASFSLACLVMELTPGPNMVYLAVTTLRDGRVAGFSVTAGIALGLLIVGLVSSLGLAAIISESPALYEGLRWCGVAYLLWLAWEGLRADSETSPAWATSDGACGTNAFRGLTTNVLNPKAAVFYIAVLPTFLTRQGSILIESLCLTVVHVLIATAVHSTIVVIAGATRPFLEDTKRSNALRAVMSLLLASVAVWLAFSTAR